MHGAPSDNVAIVYRDLQWTWGDVSRAADAVVAALDSLSLPDGARVGVVLRNRPQHVAAVLAVISSGRCVTTLNSMQPADRLAADIAVNEVPVVIADAESVADHR